MQVTCEHSSFPGHPMQSKTTSIQDVLIIEPTVYGDSRGFFMETFHQGQFQTATQTSYQFIQDNHSKSAQNVLRGLHLQTRKPQGKLVRVVHGSVFDVVVDLRPNSSTFCRWAGFELSSTNFLQLWVPPGFAHGFLTLEDSTEVIYKVTDEYDPEFELTLAWNDPDLGIAWPITDEHPAVSTKDAQGLSLAETLERMTQIQHPAP